MAGGGKASAGGRIVGWARHHVPTREGIERNRFLKPVAHRILVPSLWGFNRRSVPRGVALGLFCGVIFPFAHMPSAAILSVPTRANIPIAVGMTIPSTFLIPAYWWIALSFGDWLLSVDRAVPGQPISTDVVQHASWLHWLVSEKGPPMIVGLLALALALSTSGYVVTALGWRWRTARKWRNRHAVRATAADETI